MDNITWQSLWQYIEELESFRGASGGTVPKGAPRALPIPATSRIHAKAKTTFYAARDQARTDTRPVVQGQQKLDGRTRTRETSVDSVLGGDESVSMQDVAHQTFPTAAEQTPLPSVSHQTAPVVVQQNLPLQQAPIAAMQTAPPPNTYTFQGTSTPPVLVRKVEFSTTAAQNTLQRVQALQAKRQRLSRDKHQHT